MIKPDIDELIKQNNPFAGRTIVGPSQIWNEGFPDVPSINANASDAVFDAVDKIIQHQRHTVGITITGEKGTGKSHIISRIRHGLQAKGNSLFVYVNRYDDLNRLKHLLLDSVTQSLRARGSKPGVTQLQEIAAELINQSRGSGFTPEQYIEKFSSYPKEHCPKIVEEHTTAILYNQPDINPYLVRAIIWSLFSAYFPYANLWLSNRDLTLEMVSFLNLPNPSDRDQAAIDRLHQILNLTSDYRVPVICFDELDTTLISDSGFTVAQNVAYLVKDLYTNLKKAVFFLAMYAQTWRNQIGALSEAEAVMDRIASETRREPITLKYLKADDAVALVSTWLADFYRSHEQVPPHPLYPFDVNKLREFGKSAATMRGLLNWCAEHFTPGEVIGVTRNNRILPYFNAQLKNVEHCLDSLIEDKSKIAATLRLAFKSVINEIIEGFTIQDVEDIDCAYLDLRIIGTIKDKPVKIGVAVTEKDKRFITATLKRLVDYPQFNLTRGCLVRSKTISPNATQAREYLRTLEEQGGEWVNLQPQDIKPLLAIYSLWEIREDYQLKEAEIWEFIKQLACNNLLIRRILRGV